MNATFTLLPELSDYYAQNCPENLDLIQQVVTRLKTVNGKRRQRTLSIEDIDDLAYRAMKDGGLCYQAGGTVANSYGYRAVQTVAACWVRDGHLCIGITEQNATKGSSPISPFGGNRGRTDEENIAVMIPNIRLPLPE